MIQEAIPVRGEIVAVLEGPSGRRVFRARNIVTTAGDDVYAQRAAGASPDDPMNALVLGTGSATPTKSDVYSALTPVSGSLKLFDAGYPKADDQDTDNTGKGSNVTTYRVSYGASEANAADITHVAITNYQNGSPGASEPLLMHASFSAFTKTNADTLVVYVNHTFLGA